MYLVPEDIINNWRSEQRTKQVGQPYNTAAVTADKILTDNLKNPLISDSERSMLNTQYLGAYLNAFDKLKSPSPPQTSPAIVKQYPTVSLDSIAPQYKRQAEALLRRWESDPSVEWNDQLRMSLDGTPIQGSNVIDLISHAVSRKRASPHSAPVGFQPLKNIFKTHNFPTSLVNNRAWIDDTDAVDELRKTPSRRTPQSPPHFSDEEINSQLVSKFKNVK